MSVGKMSVGKMSVGKMSVGKMSVGKMSCRSNICRPNVQPRDGSANVRDHANHGREFDTFGNLFAPYGTAISSCMNSIVTFIYKTKSE